MSSSWRVIWRPWLWSPTRPCASQCWPFSSPSSCSPASEALSPTPGASTPIQRRPCFCQSWCFSLGSIRPNNRWVFVKPCTDLTFWTCVCLYLHCGTWHWRTFTWTWASSIFSLFEFYSGCKLVTRPPLYLKKNIVPQWLHCISLKDCYFEAALTQWMNFLLLWKLYTMPCERTHPPSVVREPVSVPNEASLDKDETEKFSQIPWFKLRSAFEGLEKMIHLVEMFPELNKT